MEKKTLENTSSNGDFISVHCSLADLSFKESEDFTMDIFCIVSCFLPETSSSFCYPYQSDFIPWKAS